MYEGDVGLDECVLQNTLGWGMSFLWLYQILMVEIPA